MKFLLSLMLMNCSAATPEQEATSQNGPPVEEVARDERATEVPFTVLPSLSGWIGGGGCPPPLKFTFVGPNNVAVTKVLVFRCPPMQFQQPKYVNPPF